jgi:hypothetical protein
MNDEYEVPRPGPFLLLWRWRTELALTGWWLLLAWVIGPKWAALVALAAVTAVVAVPHLRRLLIGRFWALVMTHRFRVACREARVCSRTGKIPIVLLARSQPYGVRLQLWCRAGTSADDLVEALPVVRDTCWSTDATIYEHTHYRHLVMIDIIRHPFGDWPTPPGGATARATTARATTATTTATTAAGPGRTGAVQGEDEDGFASAEGEFADDGRPPAAQPDDGDPPDLLKAG